MPSTTEIGNAGVAAYTYRAGRGAGLSFIGETLEEVLDLTWPAAIRTYDRIRRSDGKAASSIRAMFGPILASDWRIHPRNARDEVVQLVAEDLGLPILDDKATVPDRTRDRFDWRFYARHALLSRVYGFMPFEQVYRLDETSGLYRIRKIAPRMPHTLTYDGIRVDADGGLVGIVQQSAGRVRGETFIDRDSLVMHTHDREGYDWRGQSILRPIYRDYVLKDHYHRIAAIHIDRNGAGIPIYTDPDPAVIGEAKVDAAAEAGQKLAESYRAGESAGGRIPYSAQLAIKGVEGAIPEILAYIRYHDEQIAGSMLEMFSSLPSAPNGSRALGTSLVDFFVRSLNAHALDVATITTNHVVEDLVDANWGPEEPAPSVMCAEIGADQQLTATALMQLINAKAITPDAALEKHLRRIFHLPPLLPPLETDPPADVVDDPAALTSEPVAAA
jgi:hypothetical protein